MIDVSEFLMWRQRHPLQPYFPLHRDSMQKEIVVFNREDCHRADETFEGSLFVNRVWKGLTEDQW